MSTIPSSDDAGEQRPEPLETADQPLIQAFLAGRPGADDAIAARLAIVPRIVGALSRRLGFPMTTHDLEDVAQDAMAIALRKLAQIQPHVPLDAWLHRLCNFELCNALRRRNRLAAGALPPDLVSRDAVAIEQFERRELLFQALEQLPPDAAAIVRQHQLEGLSLAEIAAHSGTTENAVKGRYYRSIERLHEILERHRPGGAGQ